MSKMFYTRTRVGHTTHSPDEKGTSLYTIKEAQVTRLRTGSEPYPGRVISRREEIIKCRLSDKRVEEIGLLAAYREEQRRYWESVRLEKIAGPSESGLVNGHTRDALARKDVHDWESRLPLPKNDAVDDLIPMKATDDPDTAIDFDNALERISHLPLKRRKMAVGHWHHFHDGGEAC